MRQATTVEKVRVPTHHATSHVAMVGRRWRVIHHHREGIEGGSRGRNAKPRKGTRAKARAKARARARTRARRSDGVGRLKGKEEEAHNAY